MNAKAASQYEKMTQTPVSKLIISLSIPTVLTMLVSNIYNLADTAFVGTLGNSASGAIGIVFGFMSIIQAIGFLFGQGSGNIISRKLGAKDVEEASTLASIGFFSSFALGVLVSVLCFIFINPLINFLGSTETIAPYAKTYITFILLTAPFQVSSFTLNNILRYEGKAVLGMTGMLTGAVLNIFGDALFIFVFHMGIAGAGLSTAISQVISFSILISSFILKKTSCTISIKKFVFDFKRFSDIILTGFPSLFRQALGSIATILLNMEARAFGDGAVAGMSITSRIFFFIFAIALGVGQGFQPVSGFNYGAKKYSRLRKAFYFTILLSEILMIAIGLVVFFNSEVLVRLFRDDDFVVEIANRSLRLHCIAGAFMPVCMATDMLYQSTGHKLGATILSSLRSGILFIPALLILARLRGLYGIEEAQPLSFILSLLPTIFFAYFYFKKLPKTDGEE